MGDGGKGSAPRPIPNWDTFSNNFDAIFGKRDESKRANTEAAKGQKEGVNSRADSNQADDK